VARLSGRLAGAAFYAMTTTAPAGFILLQTTWQAWKERPPPALQRSHLAPGAPIAAAERLLRCASLSQDVRVTGALGVCLLFRRRTHQIHQLRCLVVVFRVDSVRDAWLVLLHLAAWRGVSGGGGRFLLAYCGGFEQGGRRTQVRRLRLRACLSAPILRLLAGRAATGW